MFSTRKPQFRINDVWQLKDGDFITLTNRQPDLPSWFELHPLETSGALFSWMRKKLNAGYKPKEIMESPNLWRAMIGDRLVWVGKKRPGIESDNDILSIVIFDEAALIIGEPLSEHKGFPNFGGFDQEEQSQEFLLRCQKGCYAVSQLGLPRCGTMDGKWAIG